MKTCLIFSPCPQLLEHAPHGPAKYWKAGGQIGIEHDRVWLGGGLSNRIGCSVGAGDTAHIKGAFVGGLEGAVVIGAAVGTSGARSTIRPTKKPFASYSWPQ